MEIQAKVLKNGQLQYVNSSTKSIIFLLTGKSIAHISICTVIEIVVSTVESEHGLLWTHGGAR